MINILVKVIPIIVRDDNDRVVRPSRRRTFFTRAAALAICHRVIFPAHVLSHKLSEKILGCNYDSALRFLVSDTPNLA